MILFVYFLSFTFKTKICFLSTVFSFFSESLFIIFDFIVYKNLFYFPQSYFLRLFLRILDSLCFHYCLLSQQTPHKLNVQSKTLLEFRVQSMNLYFLLEIVSYNCCSNDRQLIFLFLSIEFLN